MRYLAAYMLAQLGGNNRPQENDIQSILSSVGIESEQERVKLLLGQLHGRNVNELVAAGKEKLANLNFVSAPSNAVPVPATAGREAAAVPAAAAAVPAKEAKEESEESEGDLGFGLFD